MHAAAEGQLVGEGGDEHEFGVEVRRAHFACLAIEILPVGGLAACLAALAVVADGIRHAVRVGECNLVFQAACRSACAASSGERCSPACRWRRCRKSARFRCAAPGCRKDTALRSPRRWSRCSADRAWRPSGDRRAGRRSPTVRTLLRRHLDIGGEVPLLDLGRPDFRDPRGGWWRRDRDSSGSARRGPDRACCPAGVLRRRVVEGRRTPARRADSAACAGWCRFLPGRRKWCRRRGTPSSCSGCPGVQAKPTRGWKSFL